MFSVHCPHCQKELRVPNDRAGDRIRCSGCDAELQTPEAEPDEPGADRAYAVKTKEALSAAPNDISAFVEDLTKKALKRRKQKPYSRKRSPFNLLAASLLFAIALAIFLFVLLSEGGMMNMMINGILLPMIFVILGMICMVFWRK